MARATLYFTDANHPELYRIYFSHRMLGEELLAVRGKTGGAFAKERTFQWTKAVKALSVLLVRTAAKSLAPQYIQSIEAPFVLQGGQGSLASSLDYALGKNTDWLLDVFGLDSQGTPLARRLFKRSNPERKHDGPTAVSLAMPAWDKMEILVFRNHRQLKSSQDLQWLANSIECPAKEYRPKISPHTPGESSKQHNYGESAPFTPENFCLEGIRSVLFSEVKSALHGTDIFSPSQLRKTTLSIQQSASFERVAGRHKQITSILDQALSSADRLGLAESETLIRRYLCQDKPLRVHLAAPGTAAAAIFYYLARVKGYNLELNVRHPHAVDMVRRIIAGDLHKLPDACVLGIPPAATMIAHTETCKFYPLMLFPKVSIAITVPKTPETSEVNLNYGEYLLINEDPSQPSFLFEDLSREGQIQKSKIASRHMEPDEVLWHLKDGDPDTRAILFFPHYHFNSWLNNCLVLPDPRNRPLNQEMALFVHESLLRDSKRASYLDIAIRDAWLQLSTNDSLLYHVLDIMLADRDYSNSFTRSSGLFRQTFDQAQLVPGTSIGKSIDISSSTKN